MKNIAGLCIPIFCCFTLLCACGDTSDGTPPTETDVPAAVTAPPADTTPEPTPEQTPEATPEPTPEATPEPEKELSGRSLEELEASMTEYANAAAYIDGAQGEYIRRMGEDPAVMAEHLESLSISTRAYLFDSIGAYCYRPTYDNSGAERQSVDSFTSEYVNDATALLAEYMAYHAGAGGQGEHIAPPSTGCLCEAVIPETLPFLDLRTDYISEPIIVFHCYAGLFVYDRDSRQIVFSADLQTALGSTTVQGSECVSVKVSSDGGEIVLFWSEDDVPVGNCYCISCDGWSYTYGSYGQVAPCTENGFFEYDAETHGYLLCGTDGNGRSLQETVYVLGDTQVPLF